MLTPLGLRDMGGRVRKPGERLQLGKAPGQEWWLPAECAVNLWPPGWEAPGIKRPGRALLPLSRSPLHAKPAGNQRGLSGARRRMGKGGEGIWRGQKEMGSTPESLETLTLTKWTDPSFSISC